MATKQTVKKSKIREKGIGKTPIQSSLKAEWAPSTLKEERTEPAFSPWVRVKSCEWVDFSPEAMPIEFSVD